MNAVANTAELRLPPIMRGALIILRAERKKPRLHDAMNNNFPCHCTNTTS